MARYTLGLQGADKREREERGRFRGLLNIARQQGKREDRLDRLLAQALQPFLLHPFGHLRAYQSQVNCGHCRLSLGPTVAPEILHQPLIRGRVKNAFGRGQQKLKRAIPFLRFLPPFGALPGGEHTIADIRCASVIKTRIEQTRSITYRIRDDAHSGQSIRFSLRVDLRQRNHQKLHDAAPFYSRAKERRAYVTCSSRVRGRSWGIFLSAACASAVE